jgi:hypothetical protein
MKIFSETPLVWVFLGCQCKGCVAFFSGENLMADVWSHNSDVSTMPYRRQPNRLGRGPRILGESGQDLLKWAAQT